MSTTIHRSRPARARDALTPTYLLELLLVGAAYYVAAKLGLRLALVKGQVTPLWPPTGIALVAVIISGWRIWPGIALAAFFVNLPLGPNALAAAGIAVGNTLAPLVAYWLLESVGFRAQLERLRDGVALVFLGACGMLVSATGGTLTLLASGSIPAHDFATTWWVWWTGDAMGILVFAPVFLSVLSIRALARLGRARLVEGLFVLGAAGVVTYAALASRSHPLYLPFPFLIWAALRLQLWGAASSALLVSVMATLAVAHGWGPFQGETLLWRMAELHAFNGTVALTSFLLAAVTTERAVARADLERAGAELEGRVVTRTTELSAANERLEEAAEQLRDADRLKDEFLAIVSHELRTPLTPILGFTEQLLEREDFDVQMRSLLDRIHSNAASMQELVEHLLDDSRLRAGRVESHPVPLVLVDELARCVAAVAPMTNGHPISVSVSRETVVVVDRAALERIVGNLLSNAAKFSPVDSPIYVSAHVADSEVVVSVRDEGIGIAREDQERIFDRFYQSVHIGRGAGIGLSIVRRYVDMHGGRVWVESEPGRGSTFSFTLQAASGNEETP